MRANWKNAKRCAFFLFMGAGLFFVLPESQASPHDAGAADGAQSDLAEPQKPTEPKSPPAVAPASTKPAAGAVSTKDQKPASSGPGAASNAPGSTGTATPATSTQTGTLYLSERCIRTHEALLINIDHSITTELKVTKVQLVYPESVDRDHQAYQDDSSSDCGDAPTQQKGERSACLDLSNYISLDARKPIIRIDLHKARLEERRRAASGRPERSLWAWDYALFGDRPASLLITYQTAEKNQEKGEVRTVTLHPDIANRIRGAFWGVIGLLLSLSLTVLIGIYLPPEPRGSRKGESWPKHTPLYHTLFAITRTADKRYSISALQMLIWTCIATYSISYVWSMTGAVVQITPQMLALLGIGGLTAVLARFSSPTSSSIPKDYLRLLQDERHPKLRDFVTAGDEPSIYKFQMLVFTVLSAGIVAWEVTRAYVFPELPNELVLLMGISNGTYVLGSANSKVDEKELLDKIKGIVKDIDDKIDQHNASSAAAQAWTSARVVDAYLKGGVADGIVLNQEIKSQLQKLQEQLHRYLASEGYTPASESTTPPSN